MYGHFEGDMMYEFLDRLLTWRFHVRGFSRLSTDSLMGMGIIPWY
jgi:hypothetical protein